MIIKQELLSINKYSRPQKNLKDLRGIVIHWTGNAGSSAVANRNYFESLKNQADTSVYASAHYIVGLNGEVIQCLPKHEMAYHVGAKAYQDGIQARLGNYPNRTTIGIELCHPASDGRFTQQTYESAVELTASLLKEYGLDPQHDLYRHFDITGKICPKHFVEDPSAWKNFRSDVEKYLISIR